MSPHHLSKHPHELLNADFLKNLLRFISKRAAHSTQIFDQVNGFFFQNHLKIRSSEHLITGSFSVTDQSVAFYLNSQLCQLLILKFSFKINQLQPQTTHSNERPVRIRRRILQSILTSSTPIFDPFSVTASALSRSAIRSRAL